MAGQNAVVRAGEKGARAQGLAMLTARPAPPFGNRAPGWRALMETYLLPTGPARITRVIRGPLYYSARATVASRLSHLVQEGVCDRCRRIGADATALDEHGEGQVPAV